MEERDQLQDIAIAATDSERHVLSIAMRDPEQIPEIMALVNDEHFERPDHLNLWHLLQSMWRDGTAVNLTTVSKAVTLLGKDRFGGVAYVADVWDYTPSTRMDLGALVEVMHERRLRRRLRRASRELMDLTRGIMDLRVDGSTADHAMRIINEVRAVLTQSGQQDKHDFFMDEAVMAGIEEREQVEETGKGRVPTGLWGLDELLDGGLPRQEETIVVARPSCGKSALMLATMARHQATYCDLNVGVLSLEMSKVMLGNRTLAAGSDMGLSSIARSQYDRDPREWVGGNRQWLRRMRCYAGPRLSLDELLAKVYGWHSGWGLDVLYVDYLTLIKPRKGHDNHSRAVGEIAEVLKDIAKELNIAVVVLAQMNRDIEKNRSTKKLEWPGPESWIQRCKDLELFPKPAHLRDSGEVEQAADIILSPNRARVMGFNESNLDEDTLLGVVDILAAIDVCKNRNGSTGTVPVFWDGPRATFWDYAQNQPVPERRIDDRNVLL